MLELASIAAGAGLTLTAAWCLGSVAMRGITAPRVLALAPGAALLSSIVYVLFRFGMARWWAFAAVAVCAVAAWWLWARRQPTGKGTGKIPLLIGCGFAVYGLFYLVNALAPEVQPDAITYQLGLPAEWLAAGRIVPRVGFYEVLPHGVGMLFSMAFAFGKHSAAKLVEFGFLVASVPLLMALARRLGMSDFAGAAAALIYALTPVVAITGASAYTDAAIVFCVVAVFYLVLIWKDSGDARVAALIGLVAGFCYAIKPSMALIAPVAILALLAANRRWTGLVAASAGAAFAVAPWMWRAFRLTGNPLAPMFNRWFPNPYFDVELENQLSHYFHQYGASGPVNSLYELFISGEHLQGLIGPLFLLAPLGLLALRKREGRWLWIAIACCAFPWTLNHGARFLMPALPFAALAMAMALPRAAVWALVAAQLLLAAPPVMQLYASPHAWVLKKLPLRGALRMQGLDDFLAVHCQAGHAARLVDDYVPKGGKVLDFFGVANAYCHADLRRLWTHRDAARAYRAMQLAMAPSPLAEGRVSWTPQALKALRLRNEGSSEEPWSIAECWLLRNGEATVASRPWRVSAWPNGWETAQVFDRNPLTRWSTREPARAGMFLHIDFAKPLELDAAVFTFDAAPGVRATLQGQRPDGSWIELGALSGKPAGVPHAKVYAARALRSEGFRWVVLDLAGKSNPDALARDLWDHAGDWELERVDSIGPYHLLRVQSGK